MSFTELKVGGVPEHFNLPWRLAIEKKMFEKNKLNVRWKDYPGGTGAMCADLRSGELDIAVVLTEGIIADIIKGNPSKILQWYITTPLLWGIHVPANSDFWTTDDIKGKRYAISRLGSGSHLMAYVDAKMRGWELNEDQFIIVNNIDGAREAFRNNEADIFLWEKFTTQPYIDSKEFRRVGECPTPWPCFVIAASDKALQKFGKEIEKMQAVINQAAENLMREYNAPSIIAQRYDLLEKDVKNWLRVTKWSTGNSIDSSILSGVSEALYDLKLVDKKISPKDICSDLCKLK